MGFGLVCMVFILFQGYRLVTDEYQAYRELKAYEAEVMAEVDAWWEKRGGRP